MTVTWRLQASAVSGVAPEWGGGNERAGPSNRRLFRMRTGMRLATAGRIVLGCRTFAPK
jgi:hypothetical protein